MIRHRFEVEREGAKRIRDGEGERAIGLYRSEQRVIVAADPETRREVMVTDWHQAHERGEDAVMIAKRNAEVDQLNELARVKMNAAGRLGAAEVEVGGRSFAAGDEVITRVNDRKAAIYNRERWRVTEVDAVNGRVVLQGIDHDRTVALGPNYLAQVNPHSGAPALQHAYAITTYSAQGTTVERAYLAKRIERAEDGALEPGARGRHAAEALERYRAEMDTLPPAREEARRELAAVEEILASRGRLATSAARIAPPPYVLAELGRRPANLAEAKAWDRGVAVIETYRRDNDVTDQASAFGPEPKGGAARVRQRRAMERTERVQRQLREAKVRERVRERGAERSMGIGR